MRKSLLLLLLISLIFLGTPKSYAQDNATPSSVINVDYPLPYPGILPDNPLYFMKALRDKAVSFFISDPLKKAEFDLLMADVRLNAAQYLFAKGENKYSLAETTISKGENYFYDSLVKISDAKKQGMPVDDFVSKLIIAAQKHQQVVLELTSKTSGSVKDRLIEDEKRIQAFENRSMQIKPN